MNSSSLERLLLLEQSRELSPAQRKQLDATLAASAQARALRDQLRLIASSLPPPDARPTPGASQRIAARLRHTPSSSAFRPAWKSTLAAAAALALLLGVRAFRPAPSATPQPLAATTATTTADAPADEEWTDPLDSEFAELESLLLAISTDDSLETTEL